MVERREHSTTSCEADDDLSLPVFIQGWRLVGEVQIDTVVLSADQ